jgi:hypothetical protein
MQNKFTNQYWPQIDEQIRDKFYILYRGQQRTLGMALYKQFSKNYETLE